VGKITLCRGPMLHASYGLGGPAVDVLWN